MDIRYQRQKTQLMLSQPFYGSMIVRLQLEEWDKDTFGTDGEYLYVPKTCKYNDQEIMTILAHETLHCALGHVFREGNREHFKWNIACDFAVNALLDRNKLFKLPNNCLLDHQYDNFAAEEIYNRLPESKSQSLPMPDLEKPKAGNKEDGQSTEARMKELAQEWKERLAHSVESSRGTLPDGMKEIIDEILFPKLSWDQILYKFLQASKGCTDFTAYPFDRRHIYREVYLPSMTGDSIELAVAFDTSGSIGKDDLVRFFSEVRGICSVFGEYVIHLIQCDTDVHKYDIITAESDIPNFAIGRGGTSFVPVFKKLDELEISELPLVYFTDLEGEFPKNPKANTYWIIRKGNSRTKAPFGEVIAIDDRNR